MTCYSFSNPLFVARLVERFALTAIVVIAGIVILVAFWRTLHRVELHVPSVNLGGSIVLATPVLVLALLTVFTWVVVSNPVRVNCPARPVPTGPKEAPPESPGSLVGVVPDPSASSQEAPAGRPVPIDKTRLGGQLESLNCALSRASGLKQIDKSTVTDLKVDLIGQVWERGWGDYEAFGAWAAGGPDAPAPEVATLFNGVRPRC